MQNIQNRPFQFSSYFKYKLIRIISESFKIKPVSLNPKSIESLKSPIYRIFTKWLTWFSVINQ
jgi:hypothetical protein